jgi:hypothetical protein
VNDLYGNLNGGIQGQNIFLGFRMSQFFHVGQPDKTGQNILEDFKVDPMRYGENELLLGIKLSL